MTFVSVLDFILALESAYQIVIFFNKYTRHNFIVSAKRLTMDMKVIIKMISDNAKKNYKMYN